MADVEGFLERFFAFGAAPDVGRYLALFHPDATLMDSGMERPITVPEIPEHIAGVLALVPDFRMTPERWRERGGTVFVEAHNRATLGGGLVEWPSVYCVTLDGDRVIRGRRYYDRRPLFARLDPKLAAAPGEALRSDTSPLPETDAAPLVRRWSQGWESGAAGRIPPHHRALAARVTGVALECLGWAGDEELLFVEWRATAPGRLPFGIADRVALRDSDARAYYDTLALAPLADAAVA